MTVVSTANSIPTAGDEPVVSRYIERDVRAVFTHPALGILGVLTAGSISVLSGLLLSVGLADVRAGMRLGVDEASWIPTVYNMALIFMGILSIHLGTIFGQRKVLLVASAVSATAFLLAPLAATRSQLMFLLAVAGLGVGTFYPLILGYLLRALPLPLAVFALAVYVMDVLVPTYLGNWTEGIISNYFTWRWIFWTPALVIPLVFIFVYFGIPRAEVNYGGERPSFAGFFYAAWGFAFLYGAIDQGERLDWFESGTFVGLLVAAVLMLGAMTVRRLWMPNPLVRFRFLNDRNLILLGALLLLFRFSLLTTNLLIPTFLSGVAGYRPLQTGQVLWWGLIPQVVVAPLVVILLVKLDVRLLLAAGFALAAAACLMFGRINPQWSDVDFFNPIILQTVGQPFIVIGLVGSILIVMAAKGAPDKPWELATVTTFFQTVRILGAAITAAVLKHFITVQNKFHTMVVTDNLQPGDWRTAEHLQGFARQAAAAGGAPPEQAAQASRLAGAFIKEQVLTLTVADGFYFVGEAMIVCLILVVVLRSMPLALPAEGKEVKLKTDSLNGRPRVVIVGGGFGGLNAAKGLANRPVSVTLVDRKNHHTFQPLLYQVATSVLSPGEIATPLRHSLFKAKNVEVILGEVIGFDTAARRVQLDGGEELEFDYLVVAAGARHSYFGHDEWERDAPGLKTVEDATEIRRRILRAFESAEREAHLSGASQSLHFAIIGGGPTGVELAGAIADIARNAMAKDFRKIDPTKARISIFEGSPRLLGMYSEKLSLSAKRQLEELGVEVKTVSKVTAVEQGRIKVGEEWIPTTVTLWATGVAASPLGRLLRAETDRAGRVPVQPDLSIKGDKNVFVIGDMASLTDVSGTPVPGLAAAAMQEGKATAANILRDVRGEARVPFRYWDRGSMATIGRDRAVAQLGRLEFSGYVARMLWAVVHIALLGGTRNRYMVLREWLWARYTRERSARLITDNTSEIHRRASECIDGDRTVRDDAFVASGPR